MMRRGRSMGVERVLIVDDHEDIRRLLRLVLESEGVEVVAEAADGVDGLRLAEEHQPDFVILDHMMPMMTGEEAAKRMRRTAPTSVIIAFSASYDGTPGWGDAFVAKENIGGIMPVLQEMRRSA
ncbi:MAG: response regulator transcription factor [Actinomycetota bacterium]